MTGERFTSGLIRSMAFVRKELVTVWRQPRLMATLVLGPFLILFLFGLGYRETPEPFETLFVVEDEEDSPITADLDQLDEAFGGGIEPAGISDDEAAATRQLSRGEVDLVVVAPTDPVETLGRGEHPKFSVIHGEIDPVLTSNIALLSRLSLDELNRQALIDVISRAQAESEEVSASLIAAGAEEEELRQLERLQSTDPELLVRPYTIETSAMIEPPSSQAAFYAPGVLVLLAQHLAITFAALSLVQERRLGTTQLYRVSPLRVGNTLAGKYLSFLILGSILAGVLIATMPLLGVEIHGRLWQVAAVIIAVIIASLGLGFALSGLAKTDSQAVQYSMVVLLVSIFFSGFVLPLDQLTIPVRYVSLLIPGTYGISGLHDVIFRGHAPSTETIVGLGVYLMVVTVLAWLAVRREVRPAPARSVRKMAKKMATAS